MGDAHILKAGGNIDVRLTGWLYLTNSYTTYLNDVDVQFQAARIHRLQVGNLDFRLSRSWRIWGGGGVEYAVYRNAGRFRESLNAGIGYTSYNTSLRMSYRRGFTTAVGIPALFQSDIGTVALGYRITDRIGSRLEGYFYRSMAQFDYGRIGTYSVGGGMEFSLYSYLQLTLNGYYQRQLTNNYSFEGLGIERLTTYLGLRYVWPARKRTD